METAVYGSTCLDSTWLALGSECRTLCRSICVMDGMAAMGEQRLHDISSPETILLKELQQAQSIRLRYG